MFTVGEKVTTSGYPGTVIEVPTWSTGLVVIRLKAGAVCVPVEDVIKVTA